MNFEPLLRSRATDQLHDNCQRLEWDSLPASGDVAEESMFNLVPFTGAGRVVTEFKLQSGLIGEPLPGPTPQPRSRTVAAATVGGNQQAGRVRVTCAPQPLPPATNRGDRELRRVVTDAHGNACFIVDQVVDAIGHRLA